MREISVGEFRKSGLMWFANTMLHAFGIALATDKEGKTLKVLRVEVRGFDEKTNTEGYMKVSEYLKENCEELLKESKE